MVDYRDCWNHFVLFFSLFSLFLLKKDITFTIIVHRKSRNFWIFQLSSHCFPPFLPSGPRPSQIIGGRPGILPRFKGGREDGAGVDLRGRLHREDTGKSVGDQVRGKTILFIYKKIFFSCFKKSVLFHNDDVARARTHTTVFLLLVGF